jgi:hypothetical protein
VEAELFLCLLELLKETKYEILVELHNMYADEEFIGCKDNMKGGCYREITTLPISILRRMVGKREKYIHTSKYGEVYIEGTRDLLDDATSFYQNLFWPDS